MTHEDQQFPEFGGDDGASAKPSSGALASPAPTDQPDQGGADANGPAPGTYTLPIHCTEGAGTPLAQYGESIILGLREARPALNLPDPRDSDGRFTRDHAEAMGTAFWEALTYTPDPRIVSEGGETTATVNINLLMRRYREVLDKGSVVKSLYRQQTHRRSKQRTRHGIEEPPIITQGLSLDAMEEDDVAVPFESPFEDDRSLLTEWVLSKLTPSLREECDRWLDGSPATTPADRKRRQRLMAALEIMRPDVTSGDTEQCQAQGFIDAAPTGAQSLFKVGGGVGSYVTGADSR